MDSYAHYKNTILRLRNSLSDKFSSQFNGFFKNHFDNYAAKMHYNVEFLYKYLFLLADHIEVGDGISVSSASKLQVWI